MSEILKWLWGKAACEVLDILGYRDRLLKTLAPSHRIWWIATKWICVLPIHASGDYKAIETGEPNSVPDRVVSSYVPTIKILKILRRRSSYFKSLEVPEAATALLVAMPSTPAESDLPAARKEVEMVKDNISPPFRARELIHPTSGAVVGPLRDCTIGHFACHTKIDDRDPSKSRLQLLDWRTEKSLTVDRLLNLELPDCRLIYLSSCNSARDWNARETSMHIATGFLMADVPNAIGTMWKVDDTMSFEVSVTFYQNL